MGFVIGRMKKYVLIVIRKDHLIKRVLGRPKLLKMMCVICNETLILRRQQLWQTSHEKDGEEVFQSSGIR